MADLLRSLCVRPSAYADALSLMRSPLPNASETKPVGLERRESKPVGLQ